MMARLYIAHITEEVKRITKFVQNPEEAAASCSEYVNFTFYCELWWRKMAEGYTEIRAASVTIADLERSWESYVTAQNFEGTAYSKFSVQPEDITRYTVVLQNLVEKIHNSGTGELWYNLDIGEKEWDPM
ncbi:hypothetical protein PsYK624_101350 [Phanerochaete sordida]|uniref:Uncharacterized protein n=1 Tax=Phanerochaete sordida TaxID=48140 RepID=A0A9P3GFI0_9APHY|nr:hypothetical protein PsYK624_101350 [Phanerochaete sordida]